MAYFKPKQVGKCRERENIKLSFRSVPTQRVFENHKKIAKKFKKIKIFHYAFISSIKQVGKGREREKIKIIGPFRSYTTRNRKFQ